MAKKQIVNTTMSDAEKRGFAFMAKAELERTQVQTKAVGLTVLTLVPITIGLTFLASVPPIISLPLVAVGFGVPYLCNVIANRIHMNKVCKRHSNGKLSYKDFKKLQKAGEIEKWQKMLEEEHEKETAEILKSRAAKKIEGESLSTEEITELKIDTGKKDIATIESSDSKSTAETQPAVKDTDSGRNA